jgi:SAM-dependent methyltransferase
MEKKEWFASWFDTSYYHTLYKNRNDQEAEKFVTNLIDHLELPNNSSVLDLCCGKGRHSITLNKLGFNVLGVDLSPNSIKQARSFETDGLKFDVHDMRQIIEGRQFDAVFNLFTSFGYFDSKEENHKVVQSVYTMLKPGGLFVIDFMNSKKVVNSLKTRETKTVDGIEFNISRSEDGEHIYKNISFSDNGKSFDYTERVQQISFADFESILTNNGFNILSTFGNFDLQSFDEMNSDRLIIIAEKK